MHEFEYTTGYKSFPVILYEITGKRVKRRWWFGYREEWYISCDFWTWGPFNSLNEAKEMLQELNHV